MFTFLHYEIFVFLGEFFGKLASFSNITLGELHTLFSLGGYTLPYTNFYTGDTSIFVVQSFGKFFNLIFNVATDIVFVGQPLSTPLWVAFLISVVQVFLLVSFLKFIRSVF